MPDYGAHQKESTWLTGIQSWGAGFLEVRGPDPGFGPEFSDQCLFGCMPLGSKEAGLQLVLHAMVSEGGG